MTLLATGPWGASLQRCSACGALWNVGDRGAGHITVARARQQFDADVRVFPFAASAGPVAINGVWAELNSGHLFRVVIETDEGPWQVRGRGAILPLRAPARMSSLEPLTPARAADLAGEEWGEAAGAALGFALETRLDPRQLRALDFAHFSYLREGAGATETYDWERPWQRWTVEIISAMRDAGPDTDARIQGALGVVRRRGTVADEDVAAAGFLDTEAGEE